MQYCIVSAWIGIVIAQHATIDSPFESNTLTGLLNLGLVGAGLGPQEGTLE